MPNYTKELVVPLANGWSLRSAGLENECGAYVRVCDETGEEVAYWDMQEWQDEPEEVMGAILRTAQLKMRVMFPAFGDVVPTRFTHQMGGPVVHQFSSIGADRALCGFLPRGPYTPVETDITCPGCIEPHLYCLDHAPMGWPRTLKTDCKMCGR